MGRLSPLDGIGPKDIHLDRLVKRATGRHGQGDHPGDQLHGRGRSHRALRRRAAAPRGMKVTRIARGLAGGRRAGARRQRHAGAGGNRTKADLMAALPHLRQPSRARIRHAARPRARPRSRKARAGRPNRGGRRPPKPPAAPVAAPVDALAETAEGAGAGGPRFAARDGRDHQDRQGQGERRRWRHLGSRVTTEDLIQVGRRQIKFQVTTRLPRVILYHKPEGEIVTRDDPEGRPQRVREAAGDPQRQVARHRPARLQHRRLADIHDFRASWRTA